MKRPTGRELTKKIKEAKEILRTRNGLFANPAKVVGELDQLGIIDAREVWVLIRELLEEIKPGDYAGGFPPAKSYEKAIENQELLAFAWFSERLGKQMYLKFVLMKGEYYYVSLHISRVKLTENIKQRERHEVLTV